MFTEYTVENLSVILYFNLYRDNRSHTTPFKRFKASHHDEDDITSPLAGPSSSSTHTTLRVPGSAQASGYIAFSDLNRAGYNHHLQQDQHQEQRQVQHQDQQQEVFSPARSTFVSGSLFSGRNDIASSPAAAIRSPIVPAPTLMNQARTFLDTMLGSPVNPATTASTPNIAAGGARNLVSAGRALSTAASHYTTSMHNNAASTTPGQLYRPNYTSSSTTFNSTNINTTTNNVHGSSSRANHNASTPATTVSSNANYSSVKREYGYSNHSRHHDDGSREAKGSPDDLIDLTD